MTSKQELFLLATAAVIMVAIAPFAFADSLSQSGAGNVAQQDVGNTTIIGNGNNSPGSNSPSVSATGGKASAHSSSSSSASARQSQKQGQLQAQGQQQSQSANNAGNNQSVTQNYQAQKRNPVSTAFAAPLVAADDTCAGSTSAGAQGVGFGISLGSTWHDEDCVRRKDARELHNMGQKKAALALLCQSDHVAAAMAAAGTECPGRVEALAPAAGDDVPVRAHQAHHNTPTDGVIYEYPTGTRHGW